MTAEVIARLRAGQATMDVRPTAEVLDIPASTLYQAIKEGTAPVRVIRVGSRIKVLTASVIELLGGSVEPVRSSEKASDLRSSEGTGEPFTTSGVKCSGAADRAVR